MLVDLGPFRQYRTWELLHLELREPVGTVYNKGVEKLQSKADCGKTNMQGPWLSVGLLKNVCPCRRTHQVGAM
jgi:hypothetical protein